MYYFGRFLGLVLFTIIVAPMRFFFRRRHCSYHNVQVLKALQSSQFIAVCNHIKPRNKFLKMISMPYDAYIVRRMLQQYGIYSTAFASYDALGTPRTKIGIFLYNYIKEPIMKGLVKSLDLIPLNRKKHDPGTLRNMRKRLKGQGIGIGIFPEGTWFRGFRSSRKLAGGMSIIAKRYGLPILPIFLNAYNLKGEIDVRVGDLIEKPDKPADTILEVRRQMDAMAGHDWHKLAGGYDQDIHIAFNERAPQKKACPEKKSIQEIADDDLINENQSGQTNQPVGKGRTRKRAA